MYANIKHEAQKHTIYLRIILKNSNSSRNIKNKHCNTHLKHNTTKHREATKKIIPFKYSHVNASTKDLFIQYRME